MLEIQKRLNRGFLTLLSLPVTGMGFALSIQIAALSWIMAEVYGFSLEEVGLVWAAGPLAGILAQPIVGLISDNVWFWGGRRKPFILVGGVLTALALLALPNLETVQTMLGAEELLGIAVLVTLVLDLSINISFNPTRSIIADVTPDNQIRVTGYTWMQVISGTFGVGAYLISIWLGNITLIYIGSILVLAFSLIPPMLIKEPRVLGETDGDPEAKTDSAESGGIGPAFSALLPLLGFLIYAVFGLIREAATRFGGSGEEAAAEAAVHAPNMTVEWALLGLTALLFGYTFTRKKSASDPAAGFRKVMAAHAFTWLGIQTMFVFTYGWLQENFPDLSSEGLGGMISWAFFTLNAVAAVLPGILLEPMAKKYGRVMVHRICIASMCAGYVLLLMIGSGGFVLLLIAMAILGIGWASTISLVFAVMTRLADAKRMGLYMGLFNLSVVLPQLAVSLGISRYLAYVQESGGSLDMIYMISAVCLGISAIAWWGVPAGRPEDEAEAA